jgi:hypothetical protein
LTKQFAAVLDDPRDPDLTEHTFLEMVWSRVYGILAGYADQNDHANRPRAPMPSRRAGHQRNCDSIPDSGSVPPPAWLGIPRDAVAAIAGRTVRASSAPDDRSIGHHVLMPVAAATPARTRRPACPGRPPATPGRRPGRGRGPRGRPSAPAGHRGDAAGLCRPVTSALGQEGCQGAGRDNDDTPTFAVRSGGAPRWPRRRTGCPGRAGEPPVTLSRPGPTRLRSRLLRHRCPRQASFAGRPRRRRSEDHARLMTVLL